MNQKHQTRISLIGALVAMIATFGMRGSPAVAEGSSEIPKRPSIAIGNVAVADVVRGEIASPRSVLVVDGRIAAMGRRGGGVSL